MNNLNMNLIMKYYLPKTLFSQVCRLLLSIALLMLFAGFITSCSRQNASVSVITAEQREKAAFAEASPTELNISAAISLKSALQQLAEAFEKEENAKLVFNLASSGDLQTQIERGVPADVFISAGDRQMDALGKKGLIDADSRSNLLGNDLVITVPTASTARIGKIEDVATIKTIDKIAIGMAETTPVGAYTKEALEAANIWSIMQPKLVIAKDVRQVLNYVETGNVDAGFVYLSDVKTAKRAAVALKVPDAYHKPIVYPAAVLTNAEQPDLAAKFIAYLKGDGAGKVFSKFGFKPAGNP